MNKIAEKWKAFSEWQQRPYQVAEKSPELHSCLTCGEEYQGNCCPRCGQSARIGRYSFKNALLLFLDVWGVGNRGMFRTLRDLILRPGYMIRDYISGMQMAYFPPFKMYFLLLALSLVIDSGLNIQGINREKENHSEVLEITNQIVIEKKQTEETTQKKSDPNKEKMRLQAHQDVDRILDNSWDWLSQHSSFIILGGLLLFSLPLWLLIRRGPAIPDLRLSECFVMMVYISNMLILYNIIPSLLCFSLKAEAVYNLLTFLLLFIPVEQLSGYSYASTVWRVLVAFILFGFMIAILFGAFILAIFIHVKYF